MLCLLSSQHQVACKQGMNRDCAMQLYRSACSAPNCCQSTFMLWVLAPGAPCGYNTTCTSSLPDNTVGKCTSESVLPSTADCTPTGEHLPCNCTGGSSLQECWLCILQISTFRRSHAVGVNCMANTLCDKQELHARRPPIAVPGSLMAAMITMCSGNICAVGMDGTLGRCQR